VVATGTIPVPMQGYSTSIGTMATTTATTAFVCVSQYGIK